MPELVVYTAITGGFNNELRRPVVHDPAGREIRFVCFSDCVDSALTPWELCRPMWTHADPRRIARWHKVNSHVLFPRADYTLWHDGNQNLVFNPWELVDRFLRDGDIASYKHPQRDCVYEEHKACIQRKKDDPQVIRDQMDRYKAEGYPAHNGLLETTVMLRRNCPAVTDFNAAWWSEIAAGSRRDQLSVNYVLHSLKIPIVHLPGQRDRPVFFKYYPHR